MAEGQFFWAFEFLHGPTGLLGALSRRTPFALDSLETFSQKLGTLQSPANVSRSPWTCLSSCLGWTFRECWDLGFDDFKDELQLAVGSVGKRVVGRMEYRLGATGKLVMQLTASVEAELSGLLDSIYGDSNLGDETRKSLDKEVKKLCAVVHHLSEEATGGERSADVPWKDESETINLGKPLDDPNVTKLRRLDKVVSWLMALWKWECFPKNLIFFPHESDYLQPPVKAAIEDAASKLAVREGRGFAYQALILLYLDWNILRQAEHVELLSTAEVLEVFQSRMDLVNDKVLPEVHQLIESSKGMLADAICWGMTGASFEMWHLYNRHILRTFDGDEKMIHRLAVIPPGLEIFESNSHNEYSREVWHQYLVRRIGGKISPQFPTRTANVKEVNELEKEIDTAVREADAYNQKKNDVATQRLKHIGDLSPLLWHRSIYVIALTSLRNLVTPDTSSTSATRLAKTRQVNRRLAKPKNGAKRKVKQGRKKNVALRESKQQRRKSSSSKRMRRSKARRVTSFKNGMNRNALSRV